MSSSDTEFDPTLWWFWNEADGDMGKRAASLEPRTSGGQVDYAPDGAKLRAASRYTDVELVLGGFHEEQVRLLRLAHTPIAPAHRPTLSSLGTLAHVVFEMAPNSAWVMERLKTPGNSELATLVAKAKKRVNRAVRDFQKAYDQWLKETRTAAVRKRLDKPAKSR